MRAIRVPKQGDASVMECVEVATPQAGEAEILVRLEATGVNFLDIQQRLGRYPGGVSFPYIPGYEGAGTVVKVGPDAQEFSVGDRVVVVDVLGCYAEAIAVPWERAVKLPDGLQPRIAAAAILQALTAYVLVTETYIVQPGDWVLVHAGAGGSGRMLIQSAKALGAVVVATVSTEEKAIVARGVGADHVILYSHEDFVGASRALTGFPGFAAIYDSIGPGTLEPGLALLRPRGVMVSYGKSAGPIPPLELDILNRLGSLYVTRPNLMHHIRRREDLVTKSNAVFGEILANRLKVSIETVYPLAEAAAAQDALSSRATIGKLVLTPGD